MPLNVHKRKGKGKQSEEQTPSDEKEGKKLRMEKCFEIEGSEFFSKPIFYEFYLVWIIVLKVYDL